MIPCTLLHQQKYQSLLQLCDQQCIQWIFCNCFFHKLKPLEHYGPQIYVNLFVLCQIGVRQRCYLEYCLLQYSGTISDINFGIQKINHKQDQRRSIIAVHSTVHIALSLVTITQYPAIQTVNNYIHRQQSANLRPSPSNATT